MVFWEVLTLGGTMATILGVFLAIYAIINNRTLKEEARRTQELINKMDERTAKASADSREAERLTRELISKTTEETQKILHGMEENAHQVEENMNRTTQETQKILARMEENANRATQETQKILARIEENIRMTTELIAADGQKTRQAIAEFKGSV